MTSRHLYRTKQSKCTQEQDTVVSTIDNRYCESRRKALLEHVYEGYDLDLWEFTE